MSPNSTALALVHKRINSVRRKFRTLFSKQLLQLDGQELNIDSISYVKTLNIKSDEYLYGFLKTHSVLRIPIVIRKFKYHDQSLHC